MTPQERWWAFKERLPTFTRWQNISLVVISITLLLVCAICVLPFLLPLSGEMVSVETLADPDGQFISLDGLQIYYVHAPAEGDTVILLHGFGGATINWREVMPALAAAGYNTYALDLPGAGLSEKGLEIDMSHPAMANTVLNFMDALDIDRAHIVGHSMGGNIAIHLALQHPERVQTLTLAAPSLQTVTTSQIPEWLIENAVVQRWSRVILRWMMPDTVKIQLESAAEQDHVVDQSLINDHLRAFKTEDWELSLLALARDSHLNALPADLGTLEMPVLILWGEEDSWIPPGEGEKLAETIPDAQLVTFPAVGHLTMHEAPAAFNHTLINFLNSQN